MTKTSMTPFEFHTGLQAVEKTNQFNMDCPFCGRPNKFFYKDEMWDCKSASCNKKGNILTFIREIYENSTTNIQRLGTERQIPTRQLLESGWRFNPVNRTYVFPLYKYGNIVNLFKYSFDGVYATPGLTTGLMHLEEIYKDEIWIVEGHWDKCAAQCIIGSTREISTVGLVGATSFKKDWVPIFVGKKVKILLDNDEGGANGTQKILQMFEEASNKPASVEVVNWPEGLKKGYDLRDHYIEHGRSSYKVLQEYFAPPTNVEKVAKVEVKTIEPDLTCQNFSQVEEIFRQAYYTTEDMLDALILTFCSIYSNKIGGEQLWFRLIGPPGAGKTTIVNSVSGTDQTVIKSTFTGLFSGFRDGDDADASLVPLIQGKTLIVKDADALLQQPNVAKIFSELRDFYDKSSSTFYKNRANFTYENIRSTFILCGTQALRRADNSFLGERFLQFELRFTEEDKSNILDKRAERAIIEVMSEQDLPLETTLKAKIKGFVYHMMNRSPKFAPSPGVMKVVRDGCELVALMRTQLERDHLGDLLYSASPEVPTRLLGQMTKVAGCVPVVLDRDCDEDIIRILRKISMATLDPDSKRFKIVQYISERRQCLLPDVMSAFDYSRTTIQREIQDLIQLKIVKAVRIKSNAPGRKPIALELTPKVEHLMKGIFNA